MKDIKEITSALLKFRNERDWEQFHNPKDLALAISVEARELLEVFAFAFLMAERYGFDVKEIVLNKIAANGRKYPVDKSRGTAKKYNEL